MYEYEKALLKKNLEPIYDELCELGCYLAGGAITSIFTHKDINDYDLYFRSPEDAYKFVTSLDYSRWVLSESDKSFTMSVSDKTVQVIFFKYFDKAEDIFKTFDFTVCMGAFDFGKEEFVFHEDFFKDNTSRRLVFNSSTAFPINTALRVAKYKEKGYTIDRRQQMRIELAVSKLNINSVALLKRHLGGMYGEEIEKYLKLDEIEEFDLDEIIERMNDYMLEIKKESNPFNIFIESDFNTHVAEKLGYRIPYIQIDDRCYVRKNNGFERIDRNRIDKNYRLDNSFVVNEFPMVKYKCVKKIGDGLYESFYDKNYIYELGRIAVAENNFVGLFCVDEDHVRTCQYKENDGAVMLKLLVMDARDFIPSKMYSAIKGTAQVSRVYVMEEIPIQKEGV